MPKNCCKLACLCLSLLAAPVLLKAPAQAQDAGKDVPPSHWAYAAVQDLSGKGLIKGYPPDNRFLGKRPLTRYEMATIIERVLARMDDLLNQKASKNDLDNLQKSGTEIRDLVNEFKKELLVIGTDLDRAKSDLAALKVQMDDLTTRVNAQDARIDAATKAAADANTLAGSALDNVNELKNSTNAALAKKVNVGTGSLRVSGLLQVWAATPFGRTLGGNAPLNSSGTPAGRSYGGGAGDTFRLRRGEIALIGNIVPKVDYRLMFDISKIVNVSSSGGTGGVNVTSSPSSNPLQDLWVGYQFAPRFRVEIGQQKTGLSEEGTRSSSTLLTVERSIMNGLPANVGRVGDIRDTGAMLKFANSLGNITLGVFNGNGETQNDVDRDRQKFAMFNAYFTGIRHLTIGAWGGSNFGDTQPYVGKDRLGATVIYQSGPHFFEGEGAFTRDYAAVSKAGQGSSGRGGYLLYAYAISRKFQLVGRYDIWDPAYQAGSTLAGTTPQGLSLVIPRSNHKLREYTLGANYYILGNTKIQLNYIWEDPERNSIGFFGQRRELLIGNFQTAF